MGSLEESMKVDRRLHAIVGSVATVFLVMFFGLMFFAVHQDTGTARQCIASGKTYSDGECK